MIIILNFLCLLMLGIELFSIESKYDWYLLMPSIFFILSIATSSGECYLTRLENKIRKKKGLKQIKGFIKHYILKINT